MTREGQVNHRLGVFSRRLVLPTKDKPGRRFITQLHSSAIETDYLAGPSFQRQAIEHWLPPLKIMVGVSISRVLFAESEEEIKGRLPYVILLIEWLPMPCRAIWHLLVEEFVSAHPCGLRLAGLAVRQDGRSFRC